jgi:hypothetical protein
MMQRMRIVGFAVVGMTVALLVGCEVDTHKHGDGEDVKIATPFGGMRVKTDGADVLSNIGLPAYPGAQMVRKEKDNGSADVNMSFGGFQMRVTAMSYRTEDSPEKVEAFYRDGLRRFGDVIACRDDRPVGTPTKTLQGLTCDEGKDRHITVENHPAKGEFTLEAGSPQHRHLVSIDADGGGTKFGLVALDLPGKFYSDDGDDDGRR